MDFGTETIVDLDWKNEINQESDVLLRRFIFATKIIIVQRKHNFAEKVLLLLGKPKLFLENVICVQKLIVCLRNDHLRCAIIILSLPATPTNHIFSVKIMPSRRK